MTPHMKLPLLAMILGIGVAACASDEVSSGEQSASGTAVKPFVLQISSTAAGSTRGTGNGGAAAADVEIAEGGFGDTGEDVPGGDGAESNGLKDRRIDLGPGPGQAAQGKGKAKSNPELTTTLAGLNFNQQRFAN